MKSIKKTLLSLSAVLILPLMGAQVNLALASCASPANDKEAIQCGVAGANGSSTPPAPGAAATSLNTIVANGINVASIAVAVVAIIVLIVGGFRYVTSAGSQEAITSARKTITYAIIGLIVVLLAQVIVQFVLNKATK